MRRPAHSPRYVPSGVKYWTRLLKRSATYSRVVVVMVDEDAVDDVELPGPCPREPHENLSSPSELKQWIRALPCPSLT